jgi:hypothetical protein
MPGTDFSDDVDPNFDAEARPQQGPSVEMTVRNRESDPRFSRFWGDFPGDSRLPIGRESGNRESPFPDSAGTGNRGPGGGGQGACWSGADGKTRRPGPPTPPLRSGQVRPDLSDLITWFGLFGFSIQRSSSSQKTGEPGLGAALGKRAPCLEGDSLKVWSAQPNRGAVHSASFKVPPERRALYAAAAAGRAEAADFKSRQPPHAPAVLTLLDKQQCVSRCQSYDFTVTVDIILRRSKNQH